MCQATSSDMYRKRVLAEIEQRLDVLLESEAVTDFSAAAQRASVNAAVDALQAANRVNDRIGAFFSISRVRSELGDVSRQAVDKRVRSHRLLRVETADGVPMMRRIGLPRHEPFGHDARGTRRGARLLGFPVSRSRHRLAVAPRSRT